MLEKHISYISGGPFDDTFVSLNCVREALGIIDEDTDILRTIRKLREERDAKIDGLKADLELTKRLYKENRDFIDKVCEAVDIQRPYSKSGYDSTVKLISGFKKERDQLKDQVRRLRIQANSVYGAGCGYSEYSGDKAPAFLCNVISYSWGFEGGALRNGSIRVELDLTPTANYKGTFDLEDLNRYIQNYGREKKLGIIESVDYQNAKAARAELKRLYKTVLGIKDTSDIDLSPHEVMKAISNEYAQREEFIRALSCSLGFGDPIVNPDNIGQKENDILERVESLKSGVWPCENSSTFAEYLRNEFPKFCKEYNVAPIADGSSVRDWIRYIFGVLSDYRFIANGWDGPMGYKSLKEFLNDVCEILDIPSSMADDHKQILNEIHDFADRYYELRDFRADICEVLDIDADELFGSPQQNDKYILEQVEKLKNDGCKLTVFRNDVAKAVCSNPNDSNADILKAVEAVMERATELQFNTVNKDNVVQPAHSKTTRYKSLNEFRDIVYKELGLPRYGYTLIEAIDELRKRLNRKDYTELRKAIWEAMDRKPETLPEEDARLVGEIAELARGEKLLIEFRDDVAKAIGIEYPAANNVILNNVKYVYKDRKDAYDMVAKLNDQVTVLEKAKEELQQNFDYQSFRRKAIEDLKSRGFLFRYDENETLREIYAKLLKRYDWIHGAYKEQYRLRQMWHVRWESENERANGVQKKLDKLRGIEAERDKCKENCKYWSDMYSSSEAACGALKGKIRELKDEKTKVISALGQDIWDDCLK